MLISQYLEQHGLTQTAFAEVSSVPQSKISAAVRGLPASKENARLISEATGGLVSRESLLYPDEYRQGATP